MDAFKKLLKLRDWLSVPEAARHLSILLGDEVTEAHVLRFALDGRLTLSVDFVNATPARSGKVITPADAKKKIIKTSSSKSYSSINDVNLGDGRVISFGDFTFIEGVWDLAMIGAEVKSVEYKYRLLTDGLSVSCCDRNGLLVTRPDGTCGQLLQGISDDEEFNTWKFVYGTTYDLPHVYPAQSFPSNAILVVRTSALQDLVSLMSEPELARQRPVGQRERNTLLVIIAALAELNGIDVKRPSKAAMEIESATIRKGARISARAIENHLRRIPGALERTGDEGTED